MYEIHFTERAERDLRSIYEYIAVILQSVQNANGQLNRIEDAIYSLIEMPERFAVYDLEPWRSRNLRRMPIDHYLVFYIPNSSEKTVNIIRIMYGGRNIPEQLE